MKKIIKFLKVSNRWLHLIGGALTALGVAFLSLMILVAFGVIFAIPLLTIQAVSFIAVALEIKDVQAGGNFDWIDIAVTIVGTGADDGGTPLISSAPHLMRSLHFGNSS